MSSFRHIVRGFKATLAARAINMGASALLMVVLARYLLEPDAYGALFWAIGILSVVQLFADVGLGKSAARYFAEYREKDPGQLPHLIRTTVTYKLVVITLVASFLFVFHDRIAAGLGDPEAAPFLAAGVIYIAVNSFNGFTQVAFQGLDNLVYSATVRAIGGVARLVFAVGFVLLGFGALGAFFGYVIGYAIAAVVGLAILYHQFYRRYEPADRFEPGLSRRLVEYSIPLTATRTANVLDKQIDIVLVGVFLNPVAVAFYTLAKQITDFVLAPADSLGFTISPNVGELKASGDLEGARAIYETALTNVLVLYIPAAAGLAIVAEPFVRLVFGTDYLGAVPVLQILCAFVVLQAITNLTSDGLDYLGRARARAIAKAGTALTNVGLNVVLLPTIGVVGAAIATVFTHSIYVFVTLYIVHSELSLHLESLGRSIGTVVVITSAMASAVLVAATTISDVFTLVGVIAFGGVTWAILAVATGLVDLGTVRSVIVSS